MSGCAIALIVVGVIGLLSIGGIVIGAMMVRDAVDEATTVKSAAPGDEKGTLATTRKDYVGEWSGPGATLSMTPNGHVTWKKNVAGSSESYEGELTQFTGDDVVLGVMGLSFTLDVTQAPRKVGSTWQMTMEGVDITRPDTGAAAPQ